MEHAGDIFIISMIILYILAIVYTLAPFKPLKIVFHGILKWHIPERRSMFDSEYHSKCKICGKDIHKDSLGMWH